MGNYFCITTKFLSHLLYFWIKIFTFFWKNPYQKKADVLAKEKNCFLTWYKHWTLKFNCETTSLKSLICPDLCTREPEKYPSESHFVPFLDYQRLLNITEVTYFSFHSFGFIKSWINHCIQFYCHQILKYKYIYVVKKK